MNTMNHVNGTSFFSPLTSVCALCTALAFTALPATAALGGDTRNGKDVSVTDYGTVDLAVQDTDLAQVLQMLSIQSKKNIITSRSVSATVSANLFDVTFHEALDSILRVNGYGYIEEGNFIYIYTQSELEEIERSKRRTDWRIFELLGARPILPGNWGRPAPTSTTGKLRCAVRCRAVISAASSSSLTYWSSSTNVPRAVPASLAVIPVTSSKACKSCSRSPLSASPGSGSKSNPTSMSWYFTLSAFAKPASPRRAR
jgi:hypothetical protein